MTPMPRCNKCGYVSVRNKGETCASCEALMPNNDTSTDELIAIVNQFGTWQNFNDAQLVHIVESIRTKYISREAVDGAIQRVAHRGLMLIQNYKDEHGIDSIAPVGALRVGTDQLRRELGLEGDK